MKRSKHQYRLILRSSRTVAAALIPLLLLTSWPVSAWAAAGANAAAAHGPSRLAPLAARTPIRVNRVAPSVAAPPLWPIFSTQPSAAEIRRARVFEEPLIPMGGPASVKEDKALAAALLTYLKRSDGADTSAVAQFLTEHPRSVWRASLLTNLGLVYRSQGYFSRALEALEEAWKLSKHETDLEARALADRAAGELAELTARLGHEARLEALLQELSGRALRGSATEKITAAREGLWSMRHPSELALSCGPYALGRVLASLNRAADVDRVLTRRRHARALSLADLQSLAKELHLDYRMARREHGGVPVPSIVHWKVGHYGALVKEEQGRYLLEDPALDATGRGHAWVSLSVLEAEASGYFLIPGGKRPAGWHAVSPKEGRTVWGQGSTSDNDRNATKPCDKKVGGSSCQTCQAGMAQYSVHAMLVSLNIMDTPVGYTPPRGPDLHFTVTYNQREANQPANFSYSNLGPKWTFNWLSYITDNPTSPGSNVALYVQGGGAEVYSGFDSRTQSYAPQSDSQAVLVRMSATSYERRLPDGSKELFDRPDGATTTPRKIFMTAVIDSADNRVRLTYDGRRLVAIADALGQVTTLSYDLPAPNDLKITKVTDPFGRQATFQYDATGRLTSITDVINLTSAFSYDGSSDFINALMTPYGTTRFTKGEDARANSRFLEATDPLGDTERVEFSSNAPIAQSEAITPSGVAVFNAFLHARDTFFWDKKAMREHPGDYNQARVLHWFHDRNSGGTTANTLESEKAPLENRVWYNYPGQSSAAASGTQAQPSKTARVLDDGTTQLYQLEYNDLGRVTKSIDPVGRTFSFVYAPNQIDLLEVRQTRGTNNELLARFTYNAQHRPLTMTDAAGQTTRYAYNGFGQLVTATNARNEANTLTYDNNGYLVRAEGAVAGSTTTYTYDDFGRVQTITDSEGYTLVFDYDALDRVTQVTYPDGTTEQRTYNRLDLESVVDRLGRPTRYRYDALRRLISTQDAENRTTQLEWCRCGALEGIIDPLGRKTSFDYDAQNRVIFKTFPDGSEVAYTYENTTSRLKEVADAKKQTTRYLYNLDDTIRQISYSGPGVTTPSVSFTYDPDYDRLRTMQDGTGTTTYSYYPITPPALGAGQPASVVGPLPNSTITYTYDELGRVVSRAIGGVAERVTYDALGRITQATNPLGAFTYTYVNTTNRLRAVLYPNRQNTQYTYYDNLGDQRLQAIQNLDPTGAVLSQFTYSYDAEGQITGWGKQVGAQPPVLYGFENDRTGQLLTAAPQSQGAGLIANQFLYRYDGAGNRTSEQVDAALTVSNYNNLNQLVSQQAAALPDPTPVDTRSEITYDGLRHRVRMVEKENETVVSDRRFLWCEEDEGEDTVCEERDGTGATVTKRFYAQGVVITGGPNAGNYYYSSDHLESLREITDANGRVRAQYDYDPYGRVVKLAGDLDGDFGFTGHYVHLPSGLHLAPYRAYDANLGRWTSRDPIDEAGGINYYAYVDDSPINYIDPSGVDKVEDILVGFNNFNQGFTNIITFGAMDKIQGWMGTDYLINKCSGLYVAGEVAGIAWQTIVFRRIKPGQSIIDKSVTLKPFFRPFYQIGLKVTPQILRNGKVKLVVEPILTRIAQTGRITNARTLNLGILRLGIPKSFSVSTPTTLRNIVKGTLGADVANIFGGSINRIFGGPRRR